MDLGKNHQVLAYAYDDSGSTTTVSVYDSNVPDTEVTITFSTAHPERGTKFSYSGNEAELFGFFTVPYRPADPSALFDAKVARLTGLRGRDAQKNRRSTGTRRAPMLTANETTTTTAQKTVAAEEVRRRAGRRPTGNSVAMSTLKKKCTRNTPNDASESSPTYRASRDPCPITFAKML